MGCLLWLMPGLWLLGYGHAEKIMLNQHLLRQHLLASIDLGNLDMFLILRNTKKLKAEFPFEVYCTCRMPESASSDSVASVPTGII